MSETSRHVIALSDDQYDVLCKRGFGMFLSTSFAKGVYGIVDYEEPKSFNEVNETELQKGDGKIDLDEIKSMMGNSTRMKVPSNSYCIELASKADYTTVDELIRNTEKIKQYLTESL